MGGGENLKGIATYVCKTQMVRDPGSSYTNTFEVFVPAITKEKPQQTNARLWAEAQRKLHDIINGCPRGKTLSSVQQVKNDDKPPPTPVSNQPHVLIRAARALGGGIKWLFNELPKSSYAINSTFF